MDKDQIIHDAFLSMAKYDQAVTIISIEIQKLQQEHLALRNALYSLRDQN